MQWLIRRLENSMIQQNGRFTMKCLARFPKHSFYQRLTCLQYISWKPDPQAYAVDAFTQNWADMKFYAFPPFSLIRTHTTQNAGGVGRRDSCSSMLDHTSLVSSGNENAGCQPPITAKKGGSYIPPIQSQTTTFTTGEDEPDGLPLIRQSYQNLGFSTRSTDILISAWREGTQKQYRVYLRQWRDYCRTRKIDPITPPLGQALDFLTVLFDEGKQYSAINTARSALSTIVTLPGSVSFGKHPMVCRLLKGIFQLKPALPRYVDTWDVGVLLQYLRTMSNIDISLKQLTQKLTMMLILLSGQRIQTLTLLDINHITITDTCCILRSKDVLNRPDQVFTKLHWRYQYIHRILIYV